MFKILLKLKPVSQEDFDKEYKKATGDGDVFILYTCGFFNIFTLKTLSAIVVRSVSKDS